MLIPQPRHLLGPKAASQCLLDVDARQPLRERVEHVGIGVAVLHALGHALVHLVEIAGHQNQHLAVVRAPAGRIAPVLLEPFLHLQRSPAHDLDNRFTHLQGALQVARIVCREIER